MDMPRNNATPTIVMFLKLVDWPYCKVERPNAAVRAHMKHSTEAANACGMEARRAPTFPTKYQSRCMFRLYLEISKTSIQV